MASALLGVAAAPSHLTWLSPFGPLLAVLHGRAATIEETLILLLALAAIVAIVSRVLRLPYTIVLVVVGLVVGLVGSVTAVTLSADLVYYVFLPVILFQAALETPAHHLRQSWLPLTLLVLPGVLVSFVLTAVGLRALGEIWTVAWIFASLIVATDPVSVVALFRRLRVDRRLTTILDCEAMFNDGVAAVLFTIVVGALVTGNGLDPIGAGLRFVWMGGGSLVFGIALGYLAYRLHRLIDEPMLELLFTTILAYGSFLAAEALHMSGPVAVTAAGIVAGNVARGRGMTPNVRRYVESFWEYAAFLVNSLVFLLIGLSINLDEIVGHAGLVVAAFVVVVLARAANVYGFGATMMVARRPLPWSWLHVINWGGLRGAVALALALSLPSDTPHLATIRVLTFGVVLLSLLVEGLTIPLLVHALHLGKGDRRGPTREDVEAGS